MGIVSAVRCRRAATVWLLSLTLAVPATAGCGILADDRPATQAGAGPTPAAAAVVTHTAGPDAYERSGRPGNLRLVLPGADTAGPYPLVIALHSLFHDGSEAAGWGLDKLAKTAGFALVSPDGIDGSWNAGTCCDEAANASVDDVGWLHALIQHLESNYPIDPARVVIIGLSNGGMMAYRYACDHPEDVAGIAVVAGSLQQLGCRPNAPVTVVSVHGGKDGHVPGAGTPWQPALGTPITSTEQSLAPFRAADRCEAPTRPGDVTATGQDGAPRLSPALSTSSAAVTPAQIRAVLAAVAPQAQPTAASGGPASGPAAGGTAAPTPSSTTAAPTTPSFTLVTVDPVASPAPVVRTESTCATGARVVDYYLPDVDHGWPPATGPSAFDTASVLWQLLSTARAHAASVAR
ncbi:MULTISPECIES: PHB depolymerase family esterase [unclassified Pseudofrankia]|uniref:alpha/beta hydrolase family esterase n=1 Tax=unclassified Pseudofrankia TaxID=2994372 RepID=UPI0008D95AA3|nr:MULTISPECIES: PHB depolymerase family esterase [unclassified Pseudofrankia]MDT3444991.1 PHB depolymerase family esterase [Pseudofrankia sp. BMG5.37]OHV68185.1 hydrolase [Pseudofrankia sp. BMG5.36]